VRQAIVDVVIGDVGVVQRLRIPQVHAAQARRGGCNPQHAGAPLMNKAGLAGV
jgi:hypothetical protein